MNVTVTVDEGADVPRIVDELQRNGMAVNDVLDAIGVVTGSVGDADRSALAAIEGVIAVEEDHTFQLPSPDAEVQ